MTFLIEIPIVISIFMYYSYQSLAVAVDSSTKEESQTITTGKKIIVSDLYHDGFVKCFFYDSYFIT